MMFSFLRLALAALAALALPVMASAQDADGLDARMCRNGLFAAYGPFQLARVTGEGRAYFLQDMGGCPEAGDCRTARQPFVLPGDTVVISRLRMGHACAFFPNDVGGTAGYLPIDRLEVVSTDTTPIPLDWRGRWSDHDNPSLTITYNGRGGHVSGMAFWHGLPTSDGYPVIHDGEIDGPLTIVGRHARYDDGYCIVDFTLLDEYLVSNDNGRCGGANVRFISVFTKVRD